LLLADDGRLAQIYGLIWEAEKKPILMGRREIHWRPRWIDSIEEGERKANFGWASGDKRGLDKDE